MFLVMRKKEKKHLELYPENPLHMVMLALLKRSYTSILPIS